MIKKEDIKKWFDENGFIDWNGDINLVVSQVHDCITELSQDKWVSVEDRLPDDGQEVLMLMADGAVMSDLNIHTGTYYEKYGFERSRVTHWMRLPELPNDK